MSNNRIIYTVALCRKKKRRKEVTPSSSSSESEGREDGEEVWVEKKVKAEGEDIFVGPVPEIKAQAVMKNE